MVWFWKTCVLVAISSTILEALSQYPHQLSFFNHSVGGSASGHKHLSHSNVDWGQNLIAIQQWCCRSDISSIHVYYKSFRGLIQDEDFVAKSVQLSTPDGNPSKLESGYYIVSPIVYQEWGRRNLLDDCKEIDAIAGSVKVLKCE